MFSKQPLIQQIIQGMQDSVRPSDYWQVSKVELPELEAAKLIIQRDGKSVWQHTMKIIDLLTIKTPITLLSGLFHDLGKSYVHQTVRPSDYWQVPKSKFPNHDIKSANIAEIKLIEWQASSYLIDRIIRLILTHMYDVSNATREKTIRKFVADVGLDNIENWFALRIADSLSYTSYQEYHNHSYMIKSFKIVVMSYLEKLFSKDSLLQSPSESNTIIRGKDHEISDISLLTEGD